MDYVITDPIDPPWLRNVLISFLAVLLVGFALGSLFLRYHPLLRPMGRWLAAVGTLGQALGMTGLLGFCLSRRGHVEEPGGGAFVLFMLVILVWWGASLVRETKHTAFTVLSKSPTYLSQVFLTSLAAACIFRPPFGAIELDSNIYWWVASFLIFLIAMLVMVADTDFHFLGSDQDLEEEGLMRIDRAKWLTWRAWNYGLIVPYLLLGMLVLLGLRVMVAAGVGSLVAIALLTEALVRRKTV